MFGLRAAALARRLVPRSSISTTVVAHDAANMSRDAVTFYRHLRTDFILVGLMTSLGSVVGYTMFNVSIAIIAC